MKIGHVCHMCALLSASKIGIAKRDSPRILKCHRLSEFQICSCVIKNILVISHRKF